MRNFTEHGLGTARTIKDSKETINLSVCTALELHFHTTSVCGAPNSNKKRIRSMDASWLQVCFLENEATASAAVLAPNEGSSSWYANSDRQAALVKANHG